MKRLPQQHGLTKNGKKHPIYKLRERMIYYCYSVPESKSAKYNHYRGKGIQVCDEWINDIKTFYFWCMNNGWKKGLVIDRINSNGNYEPSNCRFITASENSIKARAENDQKGMKSSNHKLNDNDIKAIRLLSKSGHSTAEIARLYRVGWTTISYAIKGITWNHIKEI